jgi:lipopolysaccharide/colanic/teichoic acid biosynthesis glycosyltransferase
MEQTRYTHNDWPTVERLAFHVTTNRFWSVYRLEREFNFASKRVLDVLIASAVLLLSLPLMLVVAALIPLDSPGSPIFKQTRVSARRKRTPRGERWEIYEFTCYKFRSMYKTSSADIHKAFFTAFVRKDQAGMGDVQGQDTTVRKLVNDPRVSRIGHVIRKTSIDELPQLWNVIKGDMSLVGPRPAIPYEVAMYAPKHYRRLWAKPGLTGWWQINGRGIAEFDEGIEQDVWYVRHQSLGLDLMIMLKTPKAVLTHKGAR